MEADTVNNPRRMLPDGKLHRRAAWRYCALLLVVSLGLLSVVGTRAFLVGAIFTALLFIYSWKLRKINGAFANSVIAVSVASALSGDNIGLGTIIGTNTFNILVILGLSALFIPIQMKKQWVEGDFMIHIGAILAAAAVIILPLFGDQTFVGVTRSEGLFLFILLLVWLWFLFHRKVSEEESADYKVFTLLTSVVMVIGGIIGVFIGGQWVVNGAKTMAELFNVSPTLIGLTVVAIGTSLPELTVSVVALFKRTTAIAVGNVIGSSILNFLGIIGITALIHPIPVFDTIRFDIFIVLAAAILLLLVMYIGRKRYMLSRPEGLLFLISYGAYLIFIIMRG